MDMDLDESFVAGKVTESWEDTSPTVGWSHRRTEGDCGHDPLEAAGNFAGDYPLDMEVHPFSMDSQNSERGIKAKKLLR